MNNDNAHELTVLLGRAQTGDAKAQDEFFSRIYERLQRLTTTMLKAFPLVRSRHDVESVVHDAYLKLVRAFNEGHVPANSDEFFRFAACKLRQLLLDQTDKDRHRTPQMRIGSDGADTGSALNPAVHEEPDELAAWTEFHRRVGELPDAQRQTVELHLYMGFSQAEIAQICQLPPKQVSRLWLAATAVLAQYLPTTP